MGDGNRCRDLQRRGRSEGFSFLGHTPFRPPLPHQHERLFTAERIIAERHFGCPGVAIPLSAGLVQRRSRPMSARTSANIYVLDLPQARLRFPHRLQPRRSRGAADGQSAIIGCPARGKAGVPGIAYRPAPPPTPTETLLVRSVVRILTTKARLRSPAALKRRKDSSFQLLFLHWEADF